MIVGTEEPIDTTSSCAVQIGADGSSEMACPDSAQPPEPLPEVLESGSSGQLEMLWIAGPLLQFAAGTLVYFNQVKGNDP